MNTDHLKLRLLAKIHTVILQHAKKLLFFFSSQKIKKRDPSAYSFRITRKGKLTIIFKQFYLKLNIDNQRDSKRLI
jgi:hypothetical protein